MNFDEFISTLKDTISTLDFFTDFEKVFNNVNNIELKLTTLNYLIGKEDLQTAIND